MLGGCGAGPGADPAPQPPLAGSLPSPRPSAPESAGHDDAGGELDYTPGPSRPAAPAARALAEKFARLWARHQVSAEMWWRDLEPLCTEALHAKLRGTDPANIPADAITGAAKPVLSRRGEAVFHLRSRGGGTLILGIADLPGAGWRVATVDFRRATP